MPQEVSKLTTMFMHGPVIFSAKKDELTLKGIKQFYIDVEKDESKLDTLSDVFETISLTMAVIFCNTREKVEWLTEKLSGREFSVSAMHGDMDQAQRDVITHEFRSGTLRVLIVTDMLAEGIDVQSVPLVLNYDLPAKYENYIHHVGHDGRNGIAINLVTAEDKKIMSKIEQFYNTKINEMPLNIADLI